MVAERRDPAAQFLSHNQGCRCLRTGGVLQRSALCCALWLREQFQRAIDLHRALVSGTGPTRPLTAVLDCQPFAPYDVRIIERTPWTKAVETSCTSS